MVTGDSAHRSRPTYRRLRLLLLATCTAIMVVDTAGAQRVLGAGRAGARAGLAATPSIPGRPPAELTASPVPPTRAVAPPRSTTTTSRPPAARAAAPDASASAAVNRPAPVPAPVAPLVYRKPASPSIPTTVAPPPRPKPAPAPAPAPAAKVPQPGAGDPATSTPPDQAFEQACWVSPPDLQACNQAALADINKARAGEVLGALRLPADFYSMSVDAQLVAVANAERTSRGLPAMPENSGLDREAAAGAASGRDPSGPSGYTWDSNYAVGDPTALSADFSWMYDDGPGSENVDCSSTNRSGCWGHRHNILSPWSGSAGGGSATYDGRPALAQLFVKNP